MIPTGLHIAKIIYRGEMMTEWISVKDEDKLPPCHDVLQVKRENGDEIKAYFHKDKMAWLGFYCKAPRSHFQDHKTMEFLFDVTHWKPLSSSP